MKLLSSLAFFLASSNAFSQGNQQVIDTSFRSAAQKGAAISQSSSPQNSQVVTMMEALHEASQESKSAKSKVEDVKVELHKLVSCYAPMNFSVQNKGTYEVGTLTLSVAVKGNEKRLIAGGILNSKGIKISTVSSQFGRLTIVTDSEVNVALPYEDADFNAFLNGFELEAPTGTESLDKNVSISALLSAEKDSSDYRRLEWTNCSVSKAGVKALSQN